MNKQFWKFNSFPPAKEWVPIFSVTVVLTICILSLIGRFFKITAFMYFDAQWNPMEAITALCLILSAVALLLIRKKTYDPLRKNFARITGVFITAVSLLTIIIFIHLFSYGNESILTNASVLNLLLTSETRMSLVTAITFLILGIIILLLADFNHKKDNIAHILLFPAVIMSYFVPVSFLLNVHDLFKIDQIFVALSTGIALLFLCVTILFIRTDSWLMQILTGPNVGSIMARKLLPGLLLLPVIIGWLRIQGEQMGFYKSEVGVIVVALTYTVSFLLLVWFSARSVNRVDEKRQKAVEEQLNLQSRFGTTLASIGDAVIATDIEGNISFINPVAETLTGWTLDEAINHPVDEVFKIINEATNKEVESPIKKVLETGMPVELANHTILIRKDGTEVFIDDSAAPIKDKDGTIFGVVLVFRDISERRKAEQALRQSEQRLKFHFENSPLAVVEWNADFIVTQWSNEAEHIFGWKKEETLGKPINDLNMIYEEDIPIVNRTMERLTSGKELMVVSSNRNCTKSGKVIDCTWYNSILLDQNGQMDSVMSLVQDITEQKEVEFERQVTIDLFRLINESKNMPDFINVSTEFFQEQTGCEAVGIRLKEDEDYPFFETRGFSEEFVLLEKYLCSRDKNGNIRRDRNFNPVLECMCGNVICGRYDSAKSFFTEFGSFWTNGTTDLLNNSTKEDRQRFTRKRCVDEGYESIALIPMKLGKETIGLLQLNDKRKGAFTPGVIALIERLAGHFTLALTRFKNEEAISKQEAETRKLNSVLNESEEKYRLLFNEMLEGFAYHELIVDENGKPCNYRFLSMNPAFEKHTGLKAENVIGKTAKEVIPTLENYWIQTYGEVALTGKIIEFENYNAQLNGYFKVSAFSPKKGFFAVIVENVTDRTLATKELYNTKTYLESLINYANAPIIVWNPKLEIQLFNRAFEKLTGYSSSEVEGKKIDMLFTKSSVKEANEKIRLALHENWESIEIPILTKNGEEKIVLWNSAKIYDSDNKTLISTIAQGNEITDRIKALQRLQEAVEKLDLALDNGKIGTFERDFKTNKLIWDSRMEKMFGFKEGTFEGTYEAFEKCMVEDDIAHTREASKRAVEKNVPFESVYRIKLPNGSINHINAKGLVLRDENGNALKMAGVCFDVTDMRKGAEQTVLRLNEELLRSNKELEQFAYVASHDLQEPLRMVSSFTQLLQKRYKDKLDEDAQQFIRYAVDGAVRMQGLINDLLNYSRIGTRGQKFSDVDFNEVMGRTISNLTMNIQEKNALIVKDELPSVLGDENQLIQLMQNLISNSLKFCKTSPRIHISAVEENNHYVFSVKDNGIGINKSYFEKIFLIFQRLVSKEEYGGTGIGLAICKRIVERHGGRIWVESEVCEGSTFYFTLNKTKNI